MRMSDWSSDVCSSDLIFPVPNRVETDRRGAFNDRSRTHAESSTILASRADSVADRDGRLARCDRRFPRLEFVKEVGRLVVPVVVVPASDGEAAVPGRSRAKAHGRRSEEHKSELQSLMRTSYAVFCSKKKNKNTKRL